MYYVCVIQRTRCQSPMNLCYVMLCYVMLNLCYVMSYVHAVWCSRPMDLLADIMTRLDLNHNISQVQHGGDHDSLHLSFDKVY